KAASRLVREMLERRRPAVVATDVARLIEARKIVAATEEGKETQSADGWIRLFRSAGLPSVETVEETHWATFRGPDSVPGVFVRMGRQRTGAAPHDGRRPRVVSPGIPRASQAHDHGRTPRRGLELALLSCPGLGGQSRAIHGWPG